MGVDAGGDAFKLANEQYNLPHSRACGIKPHEHGEDCHANCPTCGGKDAVELPKVAVADNEAKGFTGIGVGTLVMRASEQAERYEQRIAEQARLLGMQGKRIQKALQVLARDEQHGVALVENTADEAAAILRGERDD